MDLVIKFALTISEMGLDPLTICVIIFASVVFIAGFIKSSRDNEYKKLMDYYTRDPKNKEN
tara:strand:- start:281 stop:463 length:183 start_codon:yes stop_codon:yes gene_type:complete